MDPTLVSLNIPMASECVRPATDRPLTEKISSPEDRPFSDKYKISDKRWRVRL